MQDVTFGLLAAEDLPEVSLKFSVSAVPTFILLRGGQVVDRIDGAKAADLTTKVKTQVSVLISLFAVKWFVCPEFTHLFCIVCSVLFMTGDFLW